MGRRRLPAVAVACIGLGAGIAAAQEVRKRGQVSRAKLEHVVAGHLAELNGKYRLRVSEVTYAPGGYIGEHHHAGPGIRCVTEGELTYVQPDRTAVYRPGDCFFESGDVSHTAENKGGRDVVLLSFEVLPADWEGSSAVPVRPAAPEVDRQLEAPKSCEPCAAWNEPVEPFRVYGNTWYVGTAGLSAVLVTGEGGHVLLDGALPQSAAHIDASIRKLGFRPQDVRLILNSHAHFDHAGGIAALARRTGAEVAASARSAEAIEAGQPPADDPQHGLGPEANGFPAARPVRRVADGEVLRVGPIAVTAHLTPGHTPGSTTYTWRSCEDGRCLDVVYADSLNAVSDPAFRFSADASRVEGFRRSIGRVAGLPCDVVISVHPGFTQVAEKAARRRERAESNPFVDPSGCRTYAEDAGRRFEKRIAEEAAAQP